MTSMNYIMRAIKVLNISNLEDTKLFKTKTTRNSKDISESKIWKRLGEQWGILTWCYVTISACKKGLIG